MERPWPGIHLERERGLAEAEGMDSRPLGILVALLGMLLCSPASAEMWKYVDENGVPHFTDSLERVPHRLRDNATEITGKIEERGSVIVPGLNGPSAEAFPTNEWDGETEPDPDVLSAQLEEMMGDNALGLLGAGIAGFVGIMLLMLPIGLAINALYLMLACKIAAPETPNFSRAFIISGVQFLASLVAGIASGIGQCALGAVSPETADSGLLNAVGGLASLAINASLLGSMLAIGFWRGVGVMVVQWLLVFATVVIPVVLLGILAGAQG